ncbi:MAG: class I SAM-dependent methyltransferase [Proteobacteria bacterium]|nr:class I SAM-dependent methyltransferase [Pseudomonadota bacterium]
MNNYKKTEHLRYDKRAQSLLAAGNTAFGTEPPLGSLAISPIYRAPYTYYEQCIRRYISQDHDVLELGAGTGLHTYALTQTGARVVASDISSHSLEVISRRIKGVTTRVADMESLPFEDNSFDVVTCAGSLSYGDPDSVDAEVRRVLRPGGILICVDSLNHNPIYRFNRWFHYLRGGRTKSTLIRMPTMERIQSISRGFKSAEVRFYGAVSYLMPILARIIGQSHAAKVSDAVDRLVHVRRSAFKFVLVARGRL